MQLLRSTHIKLINCIKLIYVENNMITRFVTGNAVAVVVQGKR